MKPLALDFMQYSSGLRLREGVTKREVFDPIRKRWYILQPEELLRQLVLQYLLLGKKYSATRIRSEQKVLINGRSKRADIVVHDADLKPWLLIECKSPKVKVTFSTFEQVAMYNMTLGVSYIAVTNGIATYICAINQTTKQYVFLDDFPDI